MTFSITATPQETVREIGRHLVALRIARNLTQAELASRAGLSKHVVERLETGAGRPSLECFTQICCALPLQDRFEALLPEQSLSSADIFRGKTPAKRVRHSKTVATRKPGGYFAKDSAT